MASPQLDSNPERLDESQFHTVWTVRIILQFVKGGTWCVVSLAVGDSCFYCCM